MSAQSMPPVARKIVRAGTPVSLVAAGALSFSGQISLAHMVGWEGPLAWLLPTAVEVYAAVATVAWMGTPEGPAKKSAGRNTFGAVGLSVVLNSLYHMIEAGVLEVSWPVILLVSIVPPLVVAAVLHMSMSLPAGAPEPAHGQEPRSEPDATARVQGSLPGPDSAEDEVPAEGGEPSDTELPVSEGEFPGKNAPASDMVTVLPPRSRGKRNPSSVAGSGRKQVVPQVTLDTAFDYVTHQLASGRPLAEVKPKELERVLGASDSWCRTVMRELKAAVPELASAVV